MNEMRAHIEKPIAVRRLSIIDSSTGGHLEVRLGTPVAIGDSRFCCQYQILGIHSGNPKQAFGVDSMEALQNAMKALDAELCILGCETALHWEERANGDLGFRRNPELESMWKAVLDADYEKAFLLARPLAEEGIAFAQSVLGLAYYLGRGVTQDTSRAIVWLKKAAEQGDPSACDALASLYGHGWKDLQADPELGAYYREQARYYGIEM